MSEASKGRGRKGRGDDEASKGLIIEGASDLPPVDPVAACRYQSLADNALLLSARARGKIAAAAYKESARWFYGKAAGCAVQPGGSDS